MNLVYWMLFTGATFSSHCIGPLDAAAAKVRLDAKYQEFLLLKKEDPSQASGWTFGMSEPYIVAPPDPAYDRMLPNCKDK